MMRPDAKVEKMYLYSKPTDFRKSIDGLAALVKLDIEGAVSDPVFFVCLNKVSLQPSHLYSASDLNGSNSSSRIFGQVGNFSSVSNTARPAPSSRSLLR